MGKSSPAPFDGFLGLLLLVRRSTKRNAQFRHRLALGPPLLVQRSATTMRRAAASLLRSSLRAVRRRAPSLRLALLTRVSCRLRSSSACPASVRLARGGQEAAALSWRLLRPRTRRWLSPSPSRPRRWRRTQAPRSPPPKWWSCWIDTSLDRHVAQERARSGTRVASPPRLLRLLCASSHTAHVRRRRRPNAPSLWRCATAGGATRSGRRCERK